MKKYLLKFTSITAFVLMFAFFMSVKAQAADVTLKGMYYDHTAVLISTDIDLDASTQRFQLLFKEGNKNVIWGTMQTSSGLPAKQSIISGLSTNKIYTLYVRRAIYNSQTKKTSYTAWTHVKTFTTAAYTFKKRGKYAGNGFTIKTPKITGIKNYKVYMSYSKTGRSKTFKKVATIKPGKKKLFKKFQNKSFPKKKGYYCIRIVPQGKGFNCVGYATINKAYDVVYIVY